MMEVRRRLGGILDSILAEQDFGEADMGLVVFSGDKKREGIFLLLVVLLRLKVKVRCN